MKLSVGLPEEDVRFLEEQEVARSADQDEVAARLRERQLADQYAEAFREWENSPDAGQWGAVTADGLLPALTST